MPSTLQQHTVSTLHQLIDLLLQLDSLTYAQPLPILSGGSLSGHVRHIAEFYLCLFQGLQNGQVDYDARKRNRLLETDNLFAIQTLQEIIRNVEEIEEDKLLYLKAAYMAEGSLLVQTTLYRELIYNLEHCIHHLATIRIGVSALTDQYSIPHNFGVAPSTIQHRQSTCAQ
ncbi:DinB family protein [Rhodocytophaga rosea]|uniref:DinB family protein n=1 Tax=Rhodocytophaga rosea TaxID=2704465 RepID=A0A6C0GUB1_9BACT|nr:DinB family protein [Rhodocytophaga rosea]QHT71785.1 DinB family protein [Rhodocytophaga rosea]